MYGEAEVQRDLSVKHGSDENLLVRFYWNAIEEDHFVKINVPGDTNTEWDRRVSEQDKHRFYKQWEAYQQKTSQFGNDSMLEETNFIDPAQIEHLHNINIHTVQALANMNDGMISQSGMGMRELVKKAKTWIDKEAIKASNEKLALELEKRDTEILLLKEQLKETRTEVENMLKSMSVKPKPRGKKKLADTV
jgi:hypothetical protein